MPSPRKGMETLEAVYLTSWSDIEEEGLKCPRPARGWKPAVHSLRSGSSNSCLKCPRPARGWKQTVRKRVMRKHDVENALAP